MILFCIVNDHLTNLGQSLWTLWTMSGFPLKRGVLYTSPSNATPQAISPLPRPQRHLCFSLHGFLHIRFVINTAGGNGLSRNTCGRRFILPSPDMVCCRLRHRPLVSPLLKFIPSHEIYTSQKPTLSTVHPSHTLLWSDRHWYDIYSQKVTALLSCIIFFIAIDDLLPSSSPLPHPKSLTITSLRLSSSSSTSLHPFCFYAIPPYAPRTNLRSFSLCCTITITFMIGWNDIFFQLHQGHLMCPTLFSSSFLVSKMIGFGHKIS